MSTLEQLYKLFLRNKVNEKYQISYIEGMVLGENLLNNYYFILLSEVDRCCNKTFNCLLTENCKTPSFIRIKECSYNPNKYECFNKNILKSKLESKAFNTLINNGLFKNLKSGKSTLDNITTIHRLNCCIYSNILNLEIHHGDKSKSRNEITNLTPITSCLHDKIDMLEEPEFSIETKRLHEAYKKGLKIPKRNTLANRDEVIFEILLDLKKGLIPSEIAKKWNNRIGITKIYEIKNYYFYLNDFLDFLYNLMFKGKWTLYENYDCQWEYIKKFDDDYTLINSGNERFYNQELIGIKEPFKKYLNSNHEGYY